MLSLKHSLENVEIMYKLRFHIKVYKINVCICLKISLFLIKTDFADAIKMTVRQQTNKKRATSTF